MSLLGNVLTVGGATLASRILGFVRDTLTAATLGTGPVADAFFVAFRLPNLFRRLFAEGAFASAFVPLLVGVREAEGAGAARRFSGQAFVALIAAVVALSIPAMIFAPELVRLLAPGFAADPAKLALAATLTRICFPYLGLITVVAFFSGVLAAERRFAAAAGAPLLLNLVLIVTLAGLILTRPAVEISGFALSIAVGIAGLAQLALLWAATARAGRLPHLARPRFEGPVARLGVLIVPGLISGGLVEINIVVGTMIASGDPGAVSWLYYADRLYQLPLGIVGIAIGQVLLPEIASVLAGGDSARAHDVQNRALEFALALVLPAALALLLLAEPIVVVLFQRGAFGVDDARETARALTFLAAGLPAFVLVRVLSPSFYARADTRTPMLAGAATVAVNVALALALQPVVGWIAVAISTAIAGWVDAALLWVILLRRGHWRGDGAFCRRLPRLALAAGVMGGIVAWGGSRLAGFLVASAPLAVKGGALATLVVVGVVVFAGLVLALRIVDLAALRSAARTAEPLPAEASCPPPSDRA